MSEMIEKRVSELEGPALDWAVAKAAHGREPWQLSEDTLGTWYVGEGDGGINDWQPSTEWSQGGPLIERYRVGIVNKTINSDPAAICQNTGWMEGATVLIAAMRAIVDAELGEVVEVPAALVGGSDA